MTGGLRIAMAAAAFLALGGCAADPALPAHEWTGPEDALDLMAARDGAVHGVAAACGLTLEDEGGRAVRLDGEIVAQRPDRFRARFRKLGRAVLDVTVTPQGRWVFSAMPDEGPGATAIEPLDPERLARVWGLLWGGGLGPDARVVDDGGRRFTVIRDDGGPGAGLGAAVRCEVDRRTLTARRYDVLDSDGAVAYTLLLERYALPGGVPWPTRLVGTDGSGRFVLDLRDVELNAEPPPGVFTPPRRAQRQP